MLIPAHKRAVRKPAKGKRTVARGIEARAVEEPIETPARSPRSLGWRVWDLYHAIAADIASDKVYKATIGKPSSANGTLLKLWSIREGRVIQSANFAADSPSVSLQTDCRRNHPRPNAAAQGPMADTVGNKTSIVANNYAHYVFI